MNTTAAETHRYDNGWDFEGRSDAWLKETFDLFATSQDEAVYRSGMRAIIAEAHSRALAIHASMPVTRTEAVRIVQAHRSATTRKVCTLGVIRDGRPAECAAPAVTTWDADFGGIVLEEGRCATHA
jgi:hypothetical protein